MYIVTFGKASSQKPPGEQSQGFDSTEHFTTILAPLVRKCPASHGEIH